MVRLYNRWRWSDKASTPSCQYVSVVLITSCSTASDVLLWGRLVRFFRCLISPSIPKRSYLAFQVPNKRYLTPLYRFLLSQSPFIKTPTCLTSGCFRLYGIYLYTNGLPPRYPQIHSCNHHSSDSAVVALGWSDGFFQLELCESSSGLWSKEAGGSSSDTVSFCHEETL